MPKIPPHHLGGQSLLHKIIVSLKGQPSYISLLWNLPYVQIFERSCTIHSLAAPPDGLVFFNNTDRITASAPGPGIHCT